MNRETIALPTYPSCPSDLQLDRLHVGELRGAAREKTQAHIAGCARCQARDAFREAGLMAFPELDAEALFLRISGASSGDTPQAKPEAPRRRLGSPVVAMIASTFVGFFAARFALTNRAETSELAGAPAIQASSEVVRAKGRSSLRVFRERRGRVDELESGNTVRAGDRLRFKVSPLASDGSADELMILSFATNGARSTYYPSDAPERSRPLELSDDGAVRGAIELDAAQEPEWLHLIRCPRPFALAEVRSVDAEHLELPRGCQDAAFLLRKEPI